MKMVARSTQPPTDRNFFGGASPLLYNTVMVALPLFDVVLSEDFASERWTKLAAEVIRSALGDIRHIENLDESLAPTDPSNFDRRTVALVRGMYEEWARSVESLLTRIARVEERQGPLPDAQALRDALGRTSAMLSISMDRLEHDHHLAQSSGIPIGEVRRELHLGTH